jgi:hypothetical protein
MAAPEPTAALALSPAQLQEVLQILGRLMPAVEVRVFGSRAKGHAKPLFDESGLPFRVDVLDWAATSPAFQSQVMAGSVVIRAAEPGAR